MTRLGENRPTTLACTGILFFWAAVGLTGCHKKVKAEFERPPAVSTVPEPKEAPPEQPDRETELPETKPEPEKEAAPPEADPSPKPVRRQKPAPPPEPMPPPEPPETRLSESEDSPEARLILEKLTRAEAILSTVEKRVLTPEQREQVAAAQAFVAQAREAYAEGDYRRAAVLADKGLILAEDLRSATRAGQL